MARRVASEAGARYYGIPIGHIISPDREDEAEARNGRPAPPGSATGSDKKRAGQSQSDDLQTSTTATVAKDKKDTIARTNELVTPTISGPVPVFAGKGKFSAPKGSGVYKSPKHPGRTYVVTPEGNAHVFTSKGELRLDPAQRSALASQIKRTFDEVVELDPEEGEQKPVTFVRLISLVRQIMQAEEVGDESEVDRLILQFRDESNRYDPESDPREVRTRVKKAVGDK